VPPVAAPPAAPAPKTLSDVAKPVPLGLAGLLTAGATVVQTYSTYDGFFADAMGSVSAWVLVLVNVLITIGLMLALTPVFKPRNVLLYAVTIALTWQALIATDLALEPIGGAEQVGEAQKINVAFIHTGIEKFLSSNIDDPVEDAKRKEITALRKRYPTDDKLATLRSDLDEFLRTDGEVDDAERKTVLEQVDGVIADEALDASQKVREIAIAVYATVGRDPIKDLLSTGASDA
jgi:hypothetical protein